MAVSKISVEQVRILSVSQSSYINSYGIHTVAYGKVAIISWWFELKSDAPIKATLFSVPNIRPKETATGALSEQGKGMYAITTIYNQATQVTSFQVDAVLEANKYYNFFIPILIE